MKNEISDAMHFRHACKLFDDTKTIPSDKFEFLLETIRLSPSSFGMEPWRLIVVRDKNLREQLKEHCWGQQQITTCSELLVFSVDIDCVKPFSDYVKKMFARRGLSEEMQDAYNPRYDGYHAGLLEDADDAISEAIKTQDGLGNRERYHWCAKQCYIALGNLMNSAAAIGIDSCPIEGFEKEEVENLLGLDGQTRQVAVIVALGYRVNVQPVKYRLSLDEIVEYR
jgi:nitroreductase